MPDVYLVLDGKTPYMVFHTYAGAREGLTKVADGKIWRITVPGGPLFGQHGGWLHVTNGEPFSPKPGKP